MKTLKNKKVEFQNAALGATKEIDTYAKLIKACVNVPPQGGYDVDIMAKRIRVTTLVDIVGEGKDIIAEDEDFKTIKECVTNMKWAFADQAIIDFVGDVKKADKTTKSTKKTK